MKRALITGITGQDGSYLAELLVGKGYRVFGTVLPNEKTSPGWLDGVIDRLAFVTADLTDSESVDRAVREAAPDEVYNLAADSFVPSSAEDPARSGNITALGVARLLRSLSRHAPKARFCQASSAYIFGRPASQPQDESTPIRPVSAYGAAKAYAHFLTSSAREGGSFACSAILYNHESPRRRPEFVTRKVTMAAARIKLGLETELRMGNLDARRDWGFAGDYVEAMWLMLQQERPDDYVIATGRAHSVQELVDAAFGAAGLDPRKHVVIDPRFLRPAEVDLLVGNPEKARRALKWEPKVDFPTLVRRMVESDLALAGGRPAEAAAK
jgi:GDPmannose 4,6-dehydratase